MALRELIDKNELQRLQDGFCKIAGISAYCLDHDGIKITRISGDDRYLHCLQEKLALERVQGKESLEDLAIEDIEGKKQVAALSVQARGEKELYWIIFRPENMTDETFYQALDLLRDTSISLLQGKLQSYGAQANSIRMEAETRRMNRGMKMIRCMGRIVQLLESNDAIETVMKEWLEAVSSFLELETAQIFKIQEDEKLMDVICEWRKEGEASFFERTSRIPAYSFLKRRVRITVNADTVMDPEFRELFHLGVKSMMILPAGPKEGGMVVALNHRKTHVFDEEEEGFAADAIKILDSILIRRIQKNALAIAHSSMEIVLDGINACVMVRDEARQKILHVNKLFKNTFGENPSDGRLAWLFGEPGEGQAELSENEDAVYSERREVYDDEKERWYELLVTDARWIDGSLCRTYSLYDVTEKKYCQGRIEQQEYADVLTGLYNRVRCERDLAEMIEQSLKENKTGAVLYLGMDDFKRINNGIGHEYGDALLKSVANAFQKIPGIGRSCYRVGGDEFVLLTAPDVYDDLDLILEDVQNVFNKPWYLKDADYYCTMSMGVVTFPENGRSVNELLQKADEAMITAKKTGKDCYYFYHEEKNGSQAE